MTRFTPGWIPPDFTKLAQNERYLVSNVLTAPASVETVLLYPPYVKQYDQGNIGACVGYSCSWMMSIYNNPDLYNAYWLYKEAQRIDNDPNTKGDQDGTYIWAALDTLRLRGHAMTKTVTPIKEKGIQSYYWAKTIDDVRAALAEGKPAVLGTYWYSEFNSPRLIDGEHWIGTRSSWGQRVGGHAICIVGASDRRQAFLLLNTWGSGYPLVWISYSSIKKLLNQQGEIAVALDIDPVPVPPPPPPPPPPPVNKMDISMVVGGVTYKGVVTKQ